MSDKNSTLQQDCEATIRELEDAISKIKAARIEPDIDTADRLFNKALVDLMDNIARILNHGATWDDIKPY